MEVKPHSPEKYPSYDWSENAALRALALQSHRWQTAYFMLPPSKITWDAFAIVQKNLPLLRNLTVNVSRATFPHDEVIEFFGDAPCLKSLMLDYGTPISALKLPRSQITYLKIRMHRETPASINSCLEALDELPNLQECLLHVGCSEPWTAIRTVHLKRLVSLTVIVEPLREDSLDRTVASLFTHLTLPSLRSLTIHSMNNRPWDNYSFVNFISQSPHLRHLTLHCTEIFGAPLIDILMETPNISWLSLTAQSDDLPQIFTSLALTGSRHSGGALLSKLKNLEIDLFGGIKELPSSLVDLVRSRTMGAEINKVCRLESVKYVTHDPQNLPHEMIFALADLGRHVDIQIFYGTHRIFPSEYQDISYDIYEEHHRKFMEL
ncbi:hypothetical protein BDQ17DRAFT_1432043 [Cyathus striatus]|nr:hypothetical protein BDQ17DRAFT_1432043 [Cyathus striatus]